MVTIHDAIRLAREVLREAQKLADAPQPPEATHEALQDLGEAARQFLLNAGEL